jgi:hypothetical protein
MKIWKDEITKKLLNMGERSEIHLKYVCRLLWSIESFEGNRQKTEKKTWSFQSVLSLSSVVDWKGVTPT